jgi:hypothetical protein
MDAIDRGVRVRPPAPGVQYVAFVDLSGGSSDDAVLAIAHRDEHERFVLDYIGDQGPRPPFDPNKAVLRFVEPLRAYRCSAVTGDRYAGETFRAQFTTHGITYHVSPQSKPELYEALEPLLNAHAVVLLDAEQAGTGAVLEQQLLGLVWRGGKIDHPSGEHDDWANAAAGAITLTASPRCQLSDAEAEELWRINFDETNVNELSMKVTL